MFVQENNKFIKWYVKKLSTCHKHDKILIKH